MIFTACVIYYVHSNLTSDIFDLESGYKSAWVYIFRLEMHLVLHHFPSLFGPSPYLCFFPFTCVMMACFMSELK